LPETTYLLTTVILIEDKQYAKTDSGGLLVILETDSGMDSNGGRDGLGELTDRGIKAVFSASRMTESGMRTTKSSLCFSAMMISTSPGRSSRREGTEAQPMAKFNRLTDSRTNPSKCAACVELTKTTFGELVGEGEILESFAVAIYILKGPPLEYISL
jgi:hypothetical protein